MSLSAMLFMFPFKNIPVSSFRPDDRKWASGAMPEVAEAVVLVAVVAKTAASELDSFSRVMGQLVASFTTSSFILIVLRFNVPVFCFH